MHTADHHRSSEGDMAAGTLRVAIIVGSTRPGRKAADVAGWVHGIAEVRDDAISAVSLSFGHDFEGFDAFIPRDVQRENVTGMLDELTAWAGALRSIREPAPVA